MINHLEVTHGHDIYKIAVRRAPGARRFTLRVRAASQDVLLTIPKRSALSDAEEFAIRNAAWIGARLKRLPSLVPFQDGVRIPILGIEHQIVHRPQARGGIWIEAGEPDLLYSGAPMLCVAGHEAHVSRRVHDFLKRLSRTEIEIRVRKHAATLGKLPSKITLRDTSSRWGSCSATGCLNFSWRLILAPEYVLDYLTAHEVAHLVFLDHSPKFWALTRKLSPETDRAEAWLSTHGASLYRYGKMENN